MNLKSNWIPHLQSYVPELTWVYKSDVEETPEVLLENVWKASPLNFIEGSNRQSTVQWGNEEFMCECLSQQELFLNQSLLIYTSMCFWSKHVLFEYAIWQLNKNIMHPSVAQYACLFLWDSPLMFPSVSPILHGLVSLSIDDKFKGGHLTKYKPIRSSLKECWNFEFNRRLWVCANQVLSRKIKTILGN